ncbi:MAG: serine hydrolase [Candidatus Hydrogenedentes bacterium]|nr:serine hydrolase [Candidatus Hydrogenedentota bacterium]
MGRPALWCMALFLVATARISAAHEGEHSADLNDAAQLEAFMDGVVNTVMYQRRIPGAVVTVVKDGQVLLNKGYGYANAEKKTPIDPERTLFRIASVSKTINATAVMQLVEQGKLDLNGEANALLKQYNAGFAIGDHYAQKIRLLDLINHTAGFDERAIGMSRLDKSKVPALGAYLASRMPPQVMPPRATTSYSNHGVAVAGYLVELASGEPYATYVRDHIFTPLGMTHSRVEWEDSIAGDIAQGYQVSGVQVKPVPFDHFCLPPAGAMLSSGADMAQFMIAHLQKGQVGDVRILGDTYVNEMHRMQYEHDARLGAGLGVSFFVGTLNGHRYIEHGGDLNGFASRIWMLPDDGVGIFTSCNVDDGTLRGAITGQFVERYFSDPDKQDVIPVDVERESVKYIGTYRNNRYARRTLEKLSTLMSEVRIASDGRGRLMLASSGGDPKTFTPTGDGILLNVRENERAVFRLGNDGSVTHLLTGGAAFERLQWYEQSRFHKAFIGAALLLFVSAVAGWPILFLSRFRKASTIKPAPAYYRVTAWFFAGLGLLLLVVLGATLMSLDQWEFTYGIPERIIYLLMLPPVIVIGAALLAINTLAVWWRGYWSAWGRLHYTLVTAACVGLVPFFVYWNLLGFNW